MKLILSSAWSYKTELTFVFLTFGIILLMPLLAVMLLTNAGIDIISGKLATQNTQTNSVDIHNPATGSVVTTIAKQMRWPLHGVVTLEFGAIDLPYQPLHTGIDIANVMDTPVTPFMDGTVIYAAQ